jgi:hypothetical protein
MQSLDSLPIDFVTREAAQHLLEGKCGSLAVRVDERRQPLARGGET